MKIAIRARGISCDQELREYVDRRMAFAFSRFGDDLSDVAVVLEDVNGPRGGLDQKCKLVITLRRVAEPIVCEATDAEIRPAIDIAAGRASRSVARALDRLSDRRKRATIR